MKVSPWVIAVAAVAFAIVAGQFGRLQYRRAVQFEAQASLALDHERNARVWAELEADKAKRLLADAVRQRNETARAEREVAVVDSLHPPDTSCAPNLAAREAVITSLKAENGSLTGVIESQTREISIIRVSNDEMRRALEARPKFYPRFVGPNVGVGVFAGIVGLRADGKPSYGVGVGVTVNVFGIRL